MLQLPLCDVYSRRRNYEKKRKKNVCANNELNSRIGNKAIVSWVCDTAVHCQRVSCALIKSNNEMQWSWFERRGKNPFSSLFSQHCVICGSSPPSAIISLTYTHGNVVCWFAHFNFDASSKSNSCLCAVKKVKQYLRWSSVVGIIFFSFDFFYGFVFYVIRYDLLSFSAIQMHSKKIFTYARYIWLTENQIEDNATTIRRTHSHRHISLFVVTSSLFCSARTNEWQQVSCKQKKKRKRNERREKKQFLREFMEIWWVELQFLFNLFSVAVHSLFLSLFLRNDLQMTLAYTPT